MIVQNLKRLVLILGSVLLLYCSPEEVLDSSSSIDPNFSLDLQQQFDYKLLEVFTPFKFQVDWDRHQRGYSNLLEKEYVEFPLLELTIQRNKPTENNYQVNKSLLAIKQSNHQWEFFLIRSYVNTSGGISKSFLDPFLFSDDLKYQGILQVLNCENKIVFAIRNNSRTQQYYFPKEMNWRSSKQNSANKYVEECEMVQVDHFIDWYLDRGEGVVEYDREQYVGTTYEEVCSLIWIPDEPMSPGGGTGSGLFVNEDCDSGENTNELNENFVEDTIHNDIDEELPCIKKVEERLEEELIITINLKGKAKCVFEKLKSTSNGFSKMIKKFDGEFPVSHLELFNSKSLPNNINAKTYPPSNFLITIEINENNLNRPNTSIARTLIHETIHAEMYRKILSVLKNGGDLNGLTINEWNQKLADGDYPGIFDYYSRYGVNGMQHQQMAAHYISTFVNYLEEFQPGLNQNIYFSLAWEGLKNTEAWYELKNDTIEIKNVIKKFNSLGSEACN